MDQQTMTVNHVIVLLKHIVENLDEHNDVNYSYDPVSSHTDWDFIPSDTIRTVYSFNGNDAPSVTTHLDGVQSGIVITFDSSIGGNQQIFLNNKILALRQIGNPAGWSYLSLNGKDKIYIDKNTAEILNSITDHMSDGKYISLHGDQVVHGIKNFVDAPLVNNDPVATHHEVAKLTNYVKTNIRDIHHIVPELDRMNGHSASSDASSGLASLSNSASSLALTTASNAIGVQSNANQASSASNSIKSLASQASNLNSSVNKVAQNSKATQNQVQSLQAKVNGFDLAGLESELQNLKSNVTNSNNELSTHVRNIVADIKRMKNVLRNTNLRAMHHDSLISEASSKADSTASMVSNAIVPVSSMSTALSTDASRLNSGDLRFYQLNQHNHKSDKRLMDAQVSLGNAYSSAGNTANNASLVANQVKGSVSTLSNATSDDVKSLSSVDTSYGAILANHADTINHLATSVSTMYGSLPAGIQSNAKEINLDGNTLSSIMSQLSNISKPSAVNTGNLSSGISANASRLNSMATDTYNIKQHNRKANKRYMDAISSLTTKASGIATNEHIDVQSLANQIKSVASSSADTKINSIASSYQAKFASQETTNGSLSDAIIANSNKASLIDNALESALAKGQLK